MELGGGRVEGGGRDGGRTHDWRLGRARSPSHPSAGRGAGRRAPLSLFSGATEPSRRWTVEWRSSVRRAGERPSSSSLLPMGDARRAAGMFASEDRAMSSRGCWGRATRRFG